MKKNEFENNMVQRIISNIKVPSEIERFHPERKKEYLLGRYCAYQAHLKLMGSELLSLNSNADRSPDWPEHLVGSISHNHEYVCCALAEKKYLKGLGIDIEELGRTKIELARYITNAQDLKYHPSFSETELLTIIFSAKESLFKALYPEVKIFFGFDSAYVSEINTSKQSFKIHLIKTLNTYFSPQMQGLFEGRYHIQDNSILTILEVK